MQSKYSFEFINDQLLNFGAVHSAAELHGFLCGLMSTGGSPADQDWPSVARKFLDIEDNTLTDEQLHLFSDFLLATSGCFSDQLLRFMPLLPSDDTSLARRAEELGAWCSGFLHGVGQILGGSQESALAPEVAEALRDIANISQAAADDDDNSEDGEGYWSELVEYVKVAVLTIHSDYKNKQLDPTVVH